MFYEGQRVLAEIGDQEWPGVVVRVHETDLGTARELLPIFVEINFNDRKVHTSYTADGRPYFGKPIRLRPAVEGTCTTATEPTFKVGQRVWSFSRGWGEVMAIHTTALFPVSVVFDCESIAVFYTLSGFLPAARSRDLFHNYFAVPQEAFTPPVHKYKPYAVGTVLKVKDDHHTSHQYVEVTLDTGDAFFYARVNSETPDTTIARRDVLQVYEAVGV